MPDLVRVRDIETGHEFTTTRAYAEAIPTLQISDKRAIDQNRVPLPPKSNLPLAQLGTPAPAPEPTPEPDHHDDQPPAVEPDHHDAA